MDSNLQKHEQAFLRACEQKLECAQMIRLNSSAYLELTAIRELLGELADNYETSFANPAYLHELGFKDAGFLSVLYLFFKRSIRDVILSRPILVWNKSDLLLAIQKYFQDGNLAALQKEFDDFRKQTQVLVEETRAREQATPHNVFDKILDEANGADLNWLARYGQYISEQEEAYCRFWFAQPDHLLDRLANHIVDAFLHGFLSQSRDRAGRRFVRMMYAIGQEALAKRVRDVLRSHGLQAIMLSPAASGYSDQYEADHQHDLAANVSRSCYEVQMEAYDSAAEQFRGNLEEICGYIRLISFGKAANPITASPHAFTPSAEARQYLREQLSHNRATESARIRPDTLSFAAVAFPDLQIGADFEAIFDAFIDLNTEESLFYELIQKEMIDLLDTCSEVHLLGKNGNKTDLLVKLQIRNDEAKETLFLNCGGDLNIPHGELFTTPRLTGTEGILHVKSIYLKGYFYRDLTLVFKDGRVVDYGCQNSEDVQLNRRMVFEQLLQGTERAPMGELAIGTNTKAYRLAKQFDIFDRLPILLAEKMGPHVAIGDPCFARGEDSAIFNLYGGKEMIARENELTARRVEDPTCYQNFHTDITIPFDELAHFTGRQADGKEVVIIDDGRFVPLAAQYLNKQLEESA